MEYEPSKRLSSAQALVHPFLFPKYFDPSRSFLASRLEERLEEERRQFQSEVIKHKAQVRELHKQYKIQINEIQNKLNFLVAKLDQEIAQTEALKQKNISIQSNFQEKQNELEKQLIEKEEQLGTIRNQVEAKIQSKRQRNEWQDEQQPEENKLQKQRHHENLNNKEKQKGSKVSYEVFSKRNVFGGSCEKARSILNMLDQ